MHDQGALSEPCDARQDLIGAFRPDERLAGGIAGVEELPDGGLQLSLIRFGGHLSKGEYDGHHGSSKARRMRRSFTDAYKTGAVRLVLDEGKTGLTTEERTELAALRKDNRELRMERDILKQAAAFFARNQA